MTIKENGFDSVVMSRGRQRSFIPHRSPSINEFLLDPYRFGGGGGGGPDPYFSNVAFLLHFNGADGSTAIVDSGPGSKSFATTGTAAIRTAQAKFGGSSFQPGTGNARCPAAAGVNLGSSDFTIETWVYLLTAPSSVCAIVANWGGSPLQLGFYLGMDVGRNLVFYYSVNGSSGVFPGFGGVTVPLGVWTHMALVRDGTVLRAYVGGVQSNAAFSIGSSAIFSAASKYMAIGSDSDGAQPFPGYIDDVRLTAGVCRYPGGSPFTPPTSQFPDS